KSEYRYAVIPLTTANYSRLEAEYVDEKDVNPGDGTNSNFCYAARNDENMVRSGKAIPNSKASNGYTWKVSKDKDKAGYAFTDLRYRWPNRNGAYLRFGNDYNVYQINPPNFEGSYFWFTYRFKISKLKRDLKPEDPLLRFQTVGFELLPGSYAREATALKAMREDNKVDDVIFSLNDLNKLADKDGFIDFNIKISYKDLVDAKLLTHFIGSERSFVQMKLININPRVYWYGNCDVELDYIDISDQMNHELRFERDRYAPNIVNHVKTIINQAPGNISGFYTFDEPLQGQFDSYSSIQDILAKEDIPVLTAVFDHQYGNITIDKQTPTYYNHVDAFLESTKPQIFSPDIYPLTAEVKFNPTNGKQADDMFIQKVWDDKLLSVYRKGKTYAMEKEGRQFIPIVQAFGRWAKGGDKDYWINWIMPPYATQKSLLYLPLCYGADGVIHYRLQSYQTEDGYGDYVGLISYMNNGKYDFPVVLEPTMSAIMDTNPKVYTYGKLIKQLEWLDSNTIMGKDARSIPPPVESYLAGASVREDSKSLYSGYVQSGYYLDKDNTPYLMLVNRRGNYFASTTEKDEKFIPALQFKERFPQAAPQIVDLLIAKQASKTFGSNAAYFDPADSVLYQTTNGVCSVEMEAGEGKLLKMVSTLPQHVKGKQKLLGESVLSGNIELEKGSNLVFGKHSNVVLLPGTQLVIPENSSVTLGGKIVLLGDAAIVIDGQVKDKSPQIMKAPTAKYIVNSKPRKGFFKRLFGCK
ncbi:MAG: hypothetical protein M0P99_08910, partial [Candidatus Cloacimonetes bacterium]|nr:hypothetical protein [Candidatus Cloacimonadota bacterium]